MVLDTFLQYQEQSGAIQGKEWHPSQQLSVVAIEKGGYFRQQLGGNTLL